MNDGLNAARGIMFGAIVGALLWFALIILFAVHQPDVEDAGCRTEFGRLTECQ